MCKREDATAGSVKPAMAARIGSYEYHVHVHVDVIRDGGHGHVAEVQSRDDEQEGALILRSRAGGGSAGRVVAT